jgi:hypothetical protein
MDKVQEEKYYFCRCELLTLVQRVYPKILRLEYQVHDNGMETVTVVWFTEAGEYSKPPIDVTADSLLALARDVLKHID